MKFNGWLSLAILVVNGCLVSGCISFLDASSVRYESKPIQVQFLSFMTQQEPLPRDKFSWRGDWLFRRYRLEEISYELTQEKPDLLIAQELVERIETPAESDQALLSTSALMGYTWNTLPLSIDELTQEEVSTGIAFAYPFQNKGETEIKTLWTFQGGYLAAFLTYIGKDPLAIFSFSQTQGTLTSRDFTSLADKIEFFLSQHHLCDARMMIAGTWQNEVHDAAYQNFLDVLKLKDAAEGFCEKEAQCYTEDSQNALYKALYGEQVPKRSTRILVPRSAFLTSSKRNFTQPGPERPYLQKYGLSTVWATARAGWWMELNLAHCP